MLFIINCNALYGYPYLVEYARRFKDTEHKVVVCGCIADDEKGKVEAAKRSFFADDSEICAEDDTRSNYSMLKILLARHMDIPLSDVLVVSDIPRDRAAADLLGVECITPAIFDVIGVKYLETRRGR